MSKEQEPKRLIIDNQSNMPMINAIEYATQVIGMGRLSNNNQQYCYATKFETGITVYSKLNKGSDVLIVRMSEDQQDKEDVEWMNITES